MHTHTRDKRAICIDLSIRGDTYYEGISIETGKWQKEDEKKDRTSKRYCVIRKLVENWKDPSNVDIQLAFSLFTLINF